MCVSPLLRLMNGRRWRSRSRALAVTIVLAMGCGLVLTAEAARQARLVAIDVAVRAPRRPRCLIRTTPACRPGRSCWPSARSVVKRRSANYDSLDRCGLVRSRATNVKIFRLIVRGGEARATPVSSRTTTGPRSVSPGHSKVVPSLVPERRREGGNVLVRRLNAHGTVDLVRIDADHVLIEGSWLTTLATSPPTSTRSGDRRTTTRCMCWLRRHRPEARHHQPERATPQSKTRGSSPRSGKW